MAGKTNARKKAPLVVACGLAVAMLGAVSVYLGALRKAVDAFRNLHESVRAVPGLGNLPSWGTVLALTTCLCIVGLAAWLPEWTARRQAATLARRLSENQALLDAAEKSRLFRLGPIPAPPEDNGSILFERADGRHQDILSWIQKSRLPLLYVTGHSGSGKSSLMQAYVVPMLCRPAARLAADEPSGTIAVMTRAFGDIDEVVRMAVVASGHVWDRPPDLSDLNAREILDKAGARVAEKKRRLVLVLDQFEELLFSADPLEQKDLPAVALVRSLQDRPIPSLCCVLVARAEFADAFRSLGLPERAEGKTWEDVPPFTIAAAAAFLARRLPDGGSSKAVTQSRAINLAREAEALVDLPGRVTPIALNMIGQMYVEDPVLGRRLAEPGVNAAEGLLPAYVRGRVESGDLRDIGPKVLGQLVTREGKRALPATTGSLAIETKLQDGAVESALLTLALHGLVRRIGLRWEVAHDFLAPLLRRVLDRISGSFLRRLRPWYGRAAAALLAAAMVWVWTIGQAHRSMTARALQEQMRIEAEETESFKQRAEVDEQTHTVKFFEPPTAASARYLGCLPGQWTLRFDWADNDKPLMLRAFQGLNLSNVVTIDFETDWDVDSWLKEIARPDSGLKGLTTLGLGDTKVTDAGLMELTRPDSGLNALTLLYLGVSPDHGDIGVTDAGLKDLARPDSGLKALATLNLYNRVAPRFADDIKLLQIPEMEPK